MEVQLIDTALHIVQLITKECSPLRNVGNSHVLIFGTIRNYIKFHLDLGNKELESFHTLIASFLLSLKILEIPITITVMKKIILQHSRNEHFSEYIRILGVSDPKSEEFMTNFTHIVSERQMKLLINLKFAPAVTCPSFGAMQYIDRTLGWYVSTENTAIKSFISKDCGELITKMLNEVCYFSGIYYTSCKMISLCCARLTLEYFVIPLPEMHRTWNHICDYSHDQSDFDSILIDCRSFIHRRWNITYYPLHNPDRFPLDRSILQTYRALPIEQGSNADGEPRCPPPPLSMYQTLVYSGSGPYMFHPFSDSAPSCRPFPLLEFGENVPKIPIFSTESLPSRKQPVQGHRFNQMKHEVYRSLTSVHAR